MFKRTGMIALKVVLDLMTEFQQDAFLACFSETVVPQIFQYATSQVKDKLLEAGCVQRFLSDQIAPRAPVLKLCKMASNGHLGIPRDVRDKWLADPVRSS